MWIKAEKYFAQVQEMTAARAKAEGQAHQLAQQVAALRVQMDWFMVRVTQLEYQNAQLIQNYMGIKMPVPEFSKPETTEVLTADKILNASISFADIGDEEAAKQGLEWDDLGRLTSNGKLVQG